MPAQPESDSPAPRALRCLVTGGLGYAGAWISRHLARQGHAVHILSRGSEKPGLGFPYTLIQGDIAALDARALSRLLPEGLDAVIHAASHNESFDPGYPRKALEVNALGTRNLLQALLPFSDRNGTLPLVIYPSTFHVYGTDTGNIDETSPARPCNDYALTHYFAEEYCRLFTRTRNLPHIVLRISNGYGAPVTPWSGKWYLLLNDLCRRAVREGEVRLQSCPAIRRDFIWLGDVAAVVERLAARSDLSGSIFNVASEKTLAIGEVAGRVAKLASKILGREVRLVMPEPSGTAAGTLTVSSQAVRKATGIVFQDRMDKEIIDLLGIAAQ